MLLDPSVMFKTRLLCAFYVLLVTLLAACTKSDPNSHIVEELVTENSYTSNEIGWTMQIPEGWKILTRNQATETIKKGRKYVEETIGQKITVGKGKNLLHLKKDQRHAFQSSAEPFISEYGADWKEFNETMKQLIMNTYSSKGMRPEVTGTTTETIDEIEFKVYEFTLYSPDGNVFLRQIAYGSLINGYDFGMSFSYIDNQIRDELLSAWRKSKFVK